MNTFWLKIAGLAVVVLGLIIIVNVFLSSETETTPKPESKTIYDQWEQDDEELRAEPQYREPPKTRPPEQPPNQRQTVQQPKPVEPPKPQFKKLSLEDEIQAQKLFEMAVTQRKMGRLPVMGYKQMVDYCRKIIRRWPDSEYAFKAKRMLADLPERYHKMYNITKEEIDLGNLK